MPKNAKKNAGGLHHQRHYPKEVIHYESQTKQQCHVALHEKFLEVRRKYRPLRFYLQAVKIIKSGESWYTSRPVRKNILSKLMASCSKAGIFGDKVNHSLRATCETRLYKVD